MVKLPLAAGGSIEGLGLPDLRPTSAVALAAAEAAVGGSLDPSSGRLAVLVTENADAATDTSSATAIAVFDTSGGELDRAMTVALPDGGPGRAQVVHWLDETTLAIERITDSSKVLDVVDLEGQLLSRTDIGWGFGEALGDRLLRTRNGDLELVDRTGAATPLTPAPQPDDNGLHRVVSAVDGGPTIPALISNPPTATPVVAPEPTPARGTTPAPGAGCFWDSPAPSGPGS